MNAKRRAVVVVVALAILIVGSVGLVSLVLEPSKSGASSVTSSGSSAAKIVLPFQSAWNLNSRTGLRLDLNLSTTSNGTLKVAVDEFNTLNQSNIVGVANSWPLAYDDLFLWTKTTCDLYLPAGYEILQGNYAQDNFTTGVPLWLEAQVFLPGCPVMLPPDSYNFTPLSDRASDVNKTFSTSGAWSGFWTGSSSKGLAVTRGGDCPGLPPLNSPSACSLTFSPFAPGTYTMVAGDEWGQIVILHFTVQE